MDPVHEEVLKTGVAPMLAGVGLILAGLYGLAGRSSPGWDTVRGTLVVVGLIAVLVPFFMFVVPRLLPPKE